MFCQYRQGRYEEVSNNLSKVPREIRDGPPQWHEKEAEIAIKEVIQPLSMAL